MKLGKLEFESALDKKDLVGEPTLKAIESNGLEGVLVSQIDPSLSDTAAFCEHYQYDMDKTVNCVILEAKRADKIWYAACLVRGANRADVNGIVRRELDARKISFAPMEKAVSLTGMEYGAINPIGLPSDWVILVDEAVAKLERTIIGSGIRDSKLLVSGSLVSSLPNAKVLNLVKD